MTGCKFPVYYLLLRASIVCNSVLSIIVRLLFFRWVVNYISYEGTRLCQNIFDLCFVLFTHSQFRKKMSHSSLLMTFGFSANSTYDSNLLLIFGKFALIWGHFQNICVCRFLGHWGGRGQTTSKSKTTKILNENL